MSFEYITFPVHHPVEGGKCSCKRSSCTSQGKHPVHEGWQQLKESIPVPEGFNVGVRGGPGGLFILDIDRKSLAEAEKVLEDIVAGRYFPRTRIVASGGGGLHVYLLAPEGVNVTNASQNFPEKVDIRGHKGMVVGPGSKHKSGSTYELLDDVDPAVAPEWLLGMLTTTINKLSAELVYISQPLNPEREKLIVQYLNEMPPCIRHEGTADNRMLEVAAHVGRRFECSLEDTIQLILEHYNPRCPEPWTEKEIRHKVRSALNYQPDIDDRGIATKKLPGPTPRLPVDKGAKPRMLKNPEHEYSFQMGRDRHNGAVDITQGTLDQIVDILSLEPKWVGVWQKDLLTQRIHAVNPPVALDAEGPGGLSDADIGTLRFYLAAENHKSFSKDNTFDAVLMVAKLVSYDPILEYLYSLPQGAVGQLEDEATKIFHTESFHARKMFAMWMRSAIARALRPGSKSDAILCLISDRQGMGKSTFGSKLFGKAWFTDQIGNIQNKDSSQALARRWCVEFSELSHLLKVDNETIKAFFSREAESYRPPYAKIDIDQPRRCVFIGTSNTQEILKDTTGNRRYWPINIEEKINTRYVEEKRDSLWANALAETLIAFEDIDAGVPDDEIRFRWWFTLDEEIVLENEKQVHMQKDPWSTSIDTVLRIMANEGISEFSTDVVLVNLATQHDESIMKLGRREQIRCANILRGLGCRKKKIGTLNLWDMPIYIPVNPHGKKAGQKISN